jgi:hypothetical protein
MQFQRSNAKPDLRQYLGVRCRYCEAPILFGLDQSRGNGPIIRSFAKLVLTCSAPDCLMRADYSRAAVSRYTKETSAERTGGGRRTTRPRA